MSQVDASHSRYKRKTTIKSRVLSATINAPGEAGVCGDLREMIFGASMALPLVTTVTVKAAGAPTLRITRLEDLAKRGRLAEAVLETYRAISPEKS